MVNHYHEINWEYIWLQGRRKRSWKSKEAQDWDKKAKSFANRNRRTPYTPLFLSRLPLLPEYTVLDIGSGPGTLALPLAEMVSSVTAMDYSEQMLDLLQKSAAEKNLNNIHCVHASWESNWDELNIEPADIAIASRSLNVADLPAALDKLDSYAKKYVFLGERIAPSPFDPDAFAAIGREFDSGPDYIITLNMLYTMGIHPNVEILQLDKTVHFNDMKEALAAYSWMFKELTAQEEKKLEKYLESCILKKSSDGLLLNRPNPPKWAMIWWKKD